jgi:hypothetical protein
MRLLLWPSPGIGVIPIFPRHLRAAIACSDPFARLEEYVRRTAVTLATAFSDARLSRTSDCHRPYYSQNAGMETHPIKVDGNDKLRWLCCLNPTRSWEFVDDRRHCRVAAKLFPGVRFSWSEARGRLVAYALFVPRGGARAHRLIGFICMRPPPSQRRGFHFARRRSCGSNAKCGHAARRNLRLWPHCRDI